MRRLAVGLMLLWGAIGLTGCFSTVKKNDNQQQIALQLQNSILTPRLFFDPLAAPVYTNFPFGLVVRATNAVPRLVDLTVVAGPDNLQGLRTVASVDNAATFTDLRLTAPGQYRIRASSPGLQDADLAVECRDVNFVLEQTTASAIENTLFRVSVMLDGPAGLQAPVELALTTNPTLANLGGTTMATLQAGQRTDFDISVDQAGTGFRLSVLNRSMLTIADVAGPLFDVTNSTNKPTAITVTPINPSLAVGGTQPFIATGTLPGGGTQDVTTTVIWTSSNLAVATISNAGVATALQAGTTPSRPDWAA